MDFQSEIETIKSGIEDAENLLTEMLQDNLIEASYENSINRVLNSLGEADTEINYIEDNMVDTDEMMEKDDVIALLEDTISNVRYG